MKALLFSRLAYNNLRRHRRRTVLIGLTVMLSAAVLAFNHSLGNGIERQMVQNLVFVQTGHLLLTPAFRDVPLEESPDRRQPIPERLKRYLAADPRIEAVQPRLESAVMISAKQQTITRAFLMGVDPAREGSYLDRLLPVLEGNPFRGLVPGEIMLSREYGRRLGVRAGDSITLTIHHARAGARMRDFRIAGMFKKSNPWQEFFLFAPLPDVQELLASQSRISAVRLILSRESDLFGVLRNLKDFFKENNLSWEVKTYREVAGFSLGIIQANRFSIILMDALLLFTAALGISLLILLSLDLRLHELRLLTWLGTPRGWLVFTVVQEALMLGAFFGMLGMVSGWAASLFFHHRGIPIHSVPISYLVGGDLLRPMIYLPGLIRLFFLVLGICFLSALVPMVNLLWRSKKLRQRYA